MAAKDATDTILSTRITGATTTSVITTPAPSSLAYHINITTTTRTTFTTAVPVNTEPQILPTQTTFPLSRVEATVVRAVQTLGCAIILTLLALTLGIFFYMREYSYERFLHMNNEIALLLGHILVLTMREITYNPVLCKTAGIGFQFFFLASFSFMMLEALQAYCIRTNVISYGGYLSKWQYFNIGWGIPAVITAASAIMKYHDYMSYWSCWLNLGSRVSYASVGPVMIYAAVTIIFAEAAGMGNYKPLLDTNRDQRTAAIANSANLFMIVPISLSAWFCGLFAVYHANIAMYGVVSILNVSLGAAVFIFHSLGNPKVHSLFKKLLSRTSSIFANRKMKNDRSKVLDGKFSDINETHESC